MHSWHAHKEHTGLRQTFDKPAGGLQETLKSVIAQYNASQLLTMREVG